MIKFEVEMVVCKVMVDGVFVIIYCFGIVVGDLCMGEM